MDMARVKEDDILKSGAEAARLFDSARQAFDAELFDTAREITRKVWQLVKAALPAAHEPKPRPKYSIIVATCHHSDDVIVALDRFTPYADDPDYEVIIVDSGNPFIETLCSVRYPRFRFHSVGFNYGCAGGRNAGAAIAYGDYVLFFDDNGRTGDSCVEALVRTIRDNNACAVGGRILAKNAVAVKDAADILGMDVKPAVITNEGISIWRKDVFERSPGFDVLLSGSEGLMLCLNLYRFVGPTAFLQAPEATLYKDAISLPGDDSGRRAAEARDRKYLTQYAGSGDDILRSLRTITDNGRQIHAFAIRSRFQGLSSLDESRAKTRVSFITTARNAKRFVQEFSDSLRWQTHGNFELVFVDDGSDDGTAQAMRACWQDDPRLKLIVSEPVGRGAALNAALDAAENEICLIADVDDLSVPFRCAATISALNEYRLDCLSFHLFNEKNAYLAGPSYLPLANDFKVRQFFGTPALFPAFAFRRSKFTLAFDTELSAGIDCDWLFRNGEANGGINGRVVQVPAVYCRTHDGQISSTKRDIQRDVALRCIMSYHEQWLGKLGDDERKLAAMLTGWEPVTQDVLPRLKAYLYRLIRATATQKDIGDGLIDALMERLGEIELDIARRKAAKAASQVQAQIPPAVPSPAQTIAPVATSEKAVVAPAAASTVAAKPAAVAGKTPDKPAAAALPEKIPEKVPEKVTEKAQVKLAEKPPEAAAPLKASGATVAKPQASIMPSAPAVTRVLTLGKKPTPDAPAKVAVPPVTTSPAPVTTAKPPVIKAPDIKKPDIKEPQIKAAEVKPVDIKPLAAKPVLPKPVAPKPEFAKPAEVKAADVGPGVIKSGDTPIPVPLTAKAPEMARPPVTPAKPVAPAAIRPAPAVMTKPVPAPIFIRPPNPAPAKTKAFEDIANPARGFNYNYITGLKQFDAGIYDEAMRFFLAAQEAKPGSMFARWARAETLIGQGRSAEAIPLLKATAMENPNNKKLGRRFEEVAAQGSQAAPSRPPEAVTAPVLSARS